MEAWPAEGPPVLWHRYLGQGYSGFVAVGDCVFTQAQDTYGQSVLCLDTDSGDEIWRYRYSWPFDYAGRTRVLIVGDLRKDDMDLVASAYRELFLAAAGGALGLFTAISRLRAVHQRIAPAIDRAGLPLYAQHVDQMSLPTLIDIFRAERDACLLGTDAVRDGVDVPGPALRLIVFDRVPWPRPTPSGPIYPNSMWCEATLGRRSWKPCTRRVGMRCWIWLASPRAGPPAGAGTGCNR